MTTATAILSTLAIVSFSCLVSEKQTLLTWETDEEEESFDGKERKYVRNHIKNDRDFSPSLHRNYQIHPMSFWLSAERSNITASLFSTNVAKCEQQPTTATSSQTNEHKDNIKSSSSAIIPAAPSKISRILHTLRIRQLPIPRQLTPNDPIFDYPSLKRGLKQRKKDEELLRGSIAKEAIEARQSGDAAKINDVFQKMSKVAYGDGVTVQMREDFMVKYGCTAYTDEILTYLVENLALERGIVEVGAGNGQWARALSDRYNEYTQKQKKQKTNFDFILPYDDKTSLPLSPQVYHEHTQPAALYFHPNVCTSDSSNSMLRKWENRGRVLLLVYPPPGPMTLDTIKTYVDVDPERNDVVVYVGEGRGGSNGNDELFDYLLNSSEWAVMKIMDVEPSPGGKGYEKMFVLKKTGRGTDETN